MSDVQDRIEVIVDLLLGAAHADDKLHGEEELAVRRLLKELLVVDELPGKVEERIKAFAPGDFDLQGTAEDFAADPPINKRKLLELVAVVGEADEEAALDEDEYIRKLGASLGLEESEYSDLVLDYEVEALRPNLDELRQPPPIPED